jgi:hypothetical protein
MDRSLGFLVRFGVRTGFVGLGVRDTMWDWSTVLVGDSYV